MVEKDKGLLKQIIKRSDRIISKASNILYIDFVSGDDIKEVICFNIFQIGELANGLSDKLTDKYN